MVRSAQRGVRVGGSGTLCGSGGMMIHVSMVHVRCILRRVLWAVIRAGGARGFMYKRLVLQDSCSIFPVRA